MLRGLNKDRVAYNQKVMEWLRTHSPRHAEELNARGQVRGWWDQINYFRVTYKPYTEAAKSIRDHHLPD